MRRARLPWWITVLAAAFLGYFGLLVYCDAWRPEPIGLEFAFAGSRMTVTRVAPGSPAARQGIEPGDAVSACQGQAIRSPYEWMALMANVEFDRAVRLTVERAGRSREVVLTLGRVGWQAVLSPDGLTRMGVRGVQAVTLALALVVAFRRPRDVVAGLGAWLLATLAVFSVVLQYRVAAVWRGLPLLVGAPLWVPFLSTQAVGAVLFTFFSVFPRVRLRSASLWAVLWAPMLLAVLPGASYMLNVVYRPDRIAERVDSWPALLIVNLIYIGAAVTMLILTYRRLDDVNERRRVRVLAIGSTVGCAASGTFVLLFWRSSPDLALYRSTGVSVGALLLLLVPLTFAYAILRHRILDIRVIIRQGVRYAVARGLLLSLVPVLVVALAVDITLSRTQPIEAILSRRAWAYAALAAAAVFAHRYRQRWLDALDRRFFRERYDAQRLLARVVEGITAAGSLDRVAPRVVAHIEEALHPQFAALLLHEPHAREYRVAAASPAGAAPPPLPAGGTWAGLAKLLGRPFDIAAGGGWLASQLPARELDCLRQAGAELLAPIGTTGETLSACLVLGSKRSEEPYTAEDRTLLGAIADNLAPVAGRPAEVPQIVRTLSECPQCGVCLDGSEAACPQDGSSLVSRRVPRELAGRYRIDRRLGRGGMATVYRAQDTALDRQVAVKLVREDLAGRADMAARFQREARAAAAFSHPNVVTVHDYGVDAGARAYLVMELLEGETLRQELRRATRLPPARVVHIMRGIAAAVDAASRRQLVHRDLKPENVFLARTSDGDDTKVLDFGIASTLRRADDTGEPLETPAEWLAGTPEYMAPEQLRGEEASPAWDVWAMVLMAYEMLAGRLPYSDCDLAGALDRLAEGHESVCLAPLGTAPPAWRVLFSRALSPDPSRRPASAASFMAELERALR